MLLLVLMVVVGRGLGVLMDIVLLLLGMGWVAIIHPVLISAVVDLHRNIFGRPTAVQNVCLLAEALQPLLVLLQREAKGSAFAGQKVQYRVGCRRLHGRRMGCDLRVLHG